MTCSQIPTHGEEQAMFALTATPLNKVAPVIRKKIVSREIYCMKVDVQPALTERSLRMRAGRGRDLWTMRKRIFTLVRRVKASMKGQRNTLEMGGLEILIATLLDTGRNNIKVKTCPTSDLLL